MWYDNFANKRLWEIFEKISSVPRESGKEEKIREFLLSFARENGLDSTTDDIGNVFITKKADTGYEKVKPLALQGHMDMVCVKKEGSSHNFDTDPIEIVTDGKYVMAKDTSLGADNGIALAMALEVMTDKSIKSGKIELICTVSEETGLTGAFNLDPDKVEAKEMINLDSEEENVIYIGCAGGIDLESTISFKREENKALHTYEISVSGLLGGHSGGEIHKERGNAINILARAVVECGKFSLVSIEGGTRRNVIPSSAKAVIATNSDISKKIEKINSKVKGELLASDPDVCISFREIEKAEAVIQKKKGMKIIKALYAAPFGVRYMSTAIKGIVDTSNNLAIVTTDRKSITVINSVRSNTESRKALHVKALEYYYSSFGFKCVTDDGYPEWEVNRKSAFIKNFVKEYQAITKKKPVVTAIHAGLECGIINKRKKGMESVSIGPNLFDVHSVNEKLEAKSAERMVAFLKKYIAERK